MAHATFTSHLLYCWGRLDPVMCQKMNRSKHSEMNSGEAIFAANPAGLFAAKEAKRANRRASGVGGRRWSCGRTSISICSYWNWKLKGHELLREICLRTQIFDLAPRGGARWSNKCKRRACIYMHIYILVPEHEHQHKYIILTWKQFCAERTGGNI